MIDLRHVASVCLAFAVLIVGGACIHRPPEPMVPQDAPHLSWEIHSRDADDFGGDEVCSSIRRTTCELRISTPDRPLGSDFIVYLHPASSEVVYTGIAEIGYLREDNAAPAKLDVNQKVPAARSFSRNPIQASLSGTVAAKAGTYNVTIKIVATMNGKSTTLNDSFAVTLRASTGAGGR